MTFSEFAKKLSSVIRGGDNTADFTHTILDAILSDDGQEVLKEYSDSSYKSFYNGTVSIKRLANKINIYVEPMNFAEFISDLPDSATQTLCDLFSEDLDGLTQFNLGDRLAELFVRILTEAAGSGSGGTATVGEKSPRKKAEVRQNAATRETNPHIFDKYISSAGKFYSKMKTLLFPDNPKPFYDFYVCNDLRIKNNSYRANIRTVKNATAKKLKLENDYVVISGTGGIGKSMMMRHLFLVTMGEWEHDYKLPIFAPLKNYTDRKSGLLPFIVRMVREFDPDRSESEVIGYLVEGNCVILLDGLDEIPQADREQFRTELEELGKRYPNNQIVLSSRPFTSFVTYSQFTVMQMVEFDKKQALELIDKLDYHNAEVKDKFRTDLNNSLYRTHRQFASNPLLLTIMLMTYNEYGEVPAKMHVFYRMAYETMARLHDASKGSYVRPMDTGLTPEDFADYFAEFCARTYKEEVIEFSKDKFREYMDKVISHKERRDSPILFSNDFLTDLTNNLCIFYEEGGQYYFIHRSFQEYFCALYFSKQMDEKLKKVGDLFEHQKVRHIGDKAFDMLYDMIPEKIDRFIFLPHLESLWAECDQKDGYWTFLETIYPTMYSQVGETSEYFENDPESFLYSFFINENDIRENGILDSFDWPSCADIYRQDWTNIETVEENSAGDEIIKTELVDVEDVSYDYIKMYGEPEIEGSSWEIDVRDVLRQTYRQKEMISCIEDDSFPLKKEYTQARMLTREMHDRYFKKPNDDDWFDDF